MKENYKFRWVTRSVKSSEVRPLRRTYRDPTADAAIGNVMREERRRKKRKEQADRRIHRQTQKYRVGVWHATEKGGSNAGK